MSHENLPVNENSIENEITTPTHTHEPDVEHHDIIDPPAPDDHPAQTPVSLADFEQFIQALRATNEPERKLDIAIQFMEERLAQTGVPHFKEFWDARRICLDLFKENINPTSLVHLLARYSELCRQARKLKEIFDEQSAFAAEQIEIAVAAIEAEIQRLQEILDDLPQVEFAIECYALRDHYTDYSDMQRELNLLNTYATKTSGLRKELIKTEMRIRQKNKFFERLSKL
ncbi:MAG: hypothetical protein LLF94_00165, partial [Chlamydiales bacterium]|nr:hypothetical protein [Chlamydiales bacterium]